jgi:hypothetical protein
VVRAWSGREAPLASLRFRGAQALLEENSAFGRKAVTDKYGRKVKHEIKEDLGKFYDIEDGEEEESAATGAEPAAGKKKGSKASKVSAFVCPRMPRWCTRALTHTPAETLQRALPGSSQSDLGFRF